MLKRARLLHLYLGLLFAPSILFFAFSGAFQLFGLHEAPGAPHWIARIAQVHKDQNLAVHEAPAPHARPTAAAAERTHSPESEPKKNLVLKWYFCCVAVGLIISTLLGIYMAFKYNRDRRIIWGLLSAGVAFPLLALFLAG